MEQVERLDPALRSEPFDGAGREFARVVPWSQGGVLGADHEGRSTKRIRSMSRARARRCGQRNWEQENPVAGWDAPSARSTIGAVTESSSTDAHSLEPLLTERALLRGVVRARREWEAGAANLDLALQPLIDDLVNVCRLTLGVLAGMHCELADRTDLDLSAETRWLAIWEISGHSIALANALVDQVEDGHTVELGGTTRALLEALALALAMAGGDEALVRRWLRGDYVKPKEASVGRRQLYERFTGDQTRRGEPIELHPEYRARRAGLAELGIDADRGMAGVLDSISGRVYGALSKIAHNTRAAIAPEVSVSLRRFSYGPHPDARVRLRYAIESIAHVKTTILDIGTAIAVIAGLDAVRPHVLEATARLHRAMDVAQGALDQVSVEPTV